MHTPSNLHFVYKTVDATGAQIHGKAGCSEFKVVFNELLMINTGLVQFPLILNPEPLEDFDTQFIF